MTAWRRSYKADPLALPLANAHYNRQNPDSPQFVPPGKSLVLLTLDERALWVTSWPDFAQHDWVGAWVNTLFRNEGAGLSSDLIRQAVAVSLHRWPEVPDMGVVTFVDPEKVRPKAHPGYCYLKAGFEHVGFTRKRRLHVLQLLPSAMPDAIEPAPRPGELFAS